jgi:hypothetical protein
MNTECKIRGLLQAYLVDDHKGDPVRFMDELILVASEVGPIRCSFAGDGKLRFQVQDQPAWEVELGRAKAKLRILCARLGVLCNESRDQDVSLYGGEGLITFPDWSWGHEDLGPSGPYDWQSSQKTPLQAQGSLSAKAARKLAIRFKNTMAEQEFTIQPQ